MPRPEGQLLDLGPWLGILLPTTIMVLVGLAVLWAARRWPRAVAAMIGVVVAVGVGIISSAAEAVDARGTRAGWLCLRVGQLLLALGCPAWLLVVIARDRNGTAVGPEGMRAWAKALLAYGLCCWFIAILVGLLIYLGTTPHGEFR